MTAEYRLTAEIVPELADGFSRIVQTKISAALKDVTASVRVTGELSPGFARDIQAKIKAELARVNVSIGVGADTKRANADIDKLIAEKRTLGADVNLKDDAARARIDVLKARARVLDSRVALDTKLAEAKLAALQARTDKINGGGEGSGGGRGGNGGFFSGALPGGQRAGPGAILGGVALALAPAAGLALAAIPLAFGAIGAAAEHMNSQVASSFSGMTTAAQDALKQGFQPLIPVFTQILGNAKSAVTGLVPVFQQAATAAAPLISSLSQGFITATVNGVSGLADAMKGLQPLADAVGNGFAHLGTAVGGFFQRLNTAAAAQGVTLLFNALDALLPIVADIINAVAPLGNAILGLVPTIASLIHGALDVLGPLLQVAAGALSGLGEIVNQIATPLGAMVVVVIALVGAMKLAALAGLDLEVSLAPLLLTLSAVAVIGASVGYGIKSIADSFTGADTQKMKDWFDQAERGAGLIKPDTGILHDVATAISTDQIRKAVDAAPTPGQANIDTANLVQTDLNQNTSLQQAATQAAQAYSDAQYQQAASGRAVEAASRGVAAAQRGVRDAQASLRDSTTSLSDAQTKLANDEVNAKTATLDLTKARREAAQALVDIRLQLTDQAATQEGATIALYQAQQSARALGIDITHGPAALPTAPLNYSNLVTSEAQLALVQAQNSYNDSLNTGNKLQVTATDAFRKGIDNADQVVAAQKAVASANLTVSQDILGVQHAQEGVNHAYQAVVDAKQSVVDAVQAHTDALRNQAAAARATALALEDLNEANAANTITTDLTTQAGRNNYKQAQDLITQDDKLGLASRDLTQKFANQETQLGLTKQQIFDTAVQTGRFSDDQMAQLAQQIGLTGPKVDALNITLHGMKVRLGDLNGIKVNFDVNGVGSIDLNSLYTSLGYTAPDIAKITQAMVSGGGNSSANPLLHAAGGAVPGWSPNKSADNIYAKLTAGEHVWTVDEVQAAGGHGAVESMRASALRGYAGGGAVTAADALGAAKAVGRGLSQGTGYDIGIALSHIFGGSAPFLPSNGKLGLSYKALAGLSGSSSPPSGLPALLGGAIPVGQHLAIIDAALAADNIPAGQWPQWERGLNTLIGRESGWNPNAINLWDSNAKAGHPSQGLGQTIPSTFAAYRNHSLPGGILDPEANVASIINYINARYHGIGNVQQANALLPPKGYDKGGDWPHNTLGFNMSGKTEAVLTGPEREAYQAQARAAVANKPVRLDDYTIARLAQALSLANNDRPVNVKVSNQGSGVFVP